MKTRIDLIPPQYRATRQQRRAAFKWFKFTAAMCVVAGVMALPIRTQVYKLKAGNAVLRASAEQHAQVGVELTRLEAELTEAWRAHEIARQARHEPHWPLLLHNLAAATQDGLLLHRLSIQGAANTAATSEALRNVVIEGSADHNHAVIVFVNRLAGLGPLRHVRVTQANADDAAAGRLRFAVGGKL